MFSVILDLNGYVYDYISLRGKTEYLILQALDSNKNDTGKKKKKIQVPAPPPASCVILGKLLSLLKLQVFQL